MLGEIAAVDPAEYERQQNASGEKAGVRSVAAFVKEMASQLPRWRPRAGQGCWERVPELKSCCIPPLPSLHSALTHLCVVCAGALTTKCPLRVLCAG